MTPVDLRLTAVLHLLTWQLKQAIIEAIKRGYSAAFDHASGAPPEQYAATLGYNRWLKVDAELASILVPNAVPHWRQIPASGIRYAAVDVADQLLLTAKSSARGVRLVGDALYRRMLASSLNYQPSLFDGVYSAQPERLSVDRAYGIVLHGNYEGTASAELPDFVAIAFPDYSFTQYLHVEYLMGKFALPAVDADSIINTPVKEEVQRWLVRPKRSNE